MRKRTQAMLPVAVAAIAFALTGVVPVFGAGAQVGPPEKPSLQPAGIGGAPALRGPAAEAPPEAIPTPPNPAKITKAKGSEAAPIDEGAQIIASIKQDSPAQALADAAPKLADLLVKLQQIDSGTWRGDTLVRSLDALSVAFNLRMSAARLKGDRAAHLAALRDYQRELKEVHRLVKLRSDQGAAGGDAKNVLLAGYYLEKVSAVLARDEGDRPGEVAALRKAAAQADSLYAACQKESDAGTTISPRLLVEASRCRYQAKAVLATRTIADPAKARAARIAALEEHLADVRRFYNSIKTDFEIGMRDADVCSLCLAACLLETCSADLAHERGDHSAEVAARKRAVAEAQKGMDAMTAKGQSGASPSPMDLFEASKHLNCAKVRLDAATAAGAAALGKLRLEAFQAHRDAVAAVLEQVRARHRDGAAGGGVGDLAYAAARYAWIRLQIAALEKTPATAAVQIQTTIPAARR